jgi:hypothetical protein
MPLRLLCANWQGCMSAFTRGRLGVKGTIAVRVVGLVPVSVVFNGHGVGLVVVGAEME